jgi:uncharacterized protein
MRVVVDTNVLVSAGLKAETAPRNAVLWIRRHGRFLKSDATERELRLTVARPKLLRLLANSAFLEELLHLMDAAEQIQVIETVRACRDQDDDKFLEVAINGNADRIIAGDPDLLVLDGFRGIRIVDPANFLRAVTG